MTIEEAIEHIQDIICENTPPNITTFKLEKEALYMAIDALKKMGGRKMKYDCSKTLDYAHERRRMCDAFDKDGDCDKCQLQGVGGNCYNTRSITQEHIDIVQKWSDEHPEKTRKEAFLELFPKASISSDGLPKNCFAVLIGQENTMCVGRCCDDCWLDPYNGEFEKAREEEK